MHLVGHFSKLLMYIRLRSYSFWLPDNADLSQSDQPFIWCWKILAKFGTHAGNVKFYTQNET